MCRFGFDALIVITMIEPRFFLHQCLDLSQVAAMSAFKANGSVSEQRYGVTLASPRGSMRPPFTLNLSKGWPGRA